MVLDPAQVPMELATRPLVFQEALLEQLAAVAMSKSQALVA
jgi:hypothetical protein